MQSFNIEEVIGVFEAVSDQEEKITDLKAQMKMIGADNAKRFEEFAKERNYIFGQDDMGNCYLFLKFLVGIFHFL